MLISDWDESVCEELEDKVEHLKELHDDFKDYMSLDESLAVLNMITEFSQLCRTWRENQEE